MRSLATLLDFSSTLVAKLCTSLQLRSALDARHGLPGSYHFGAAIITEFCARQICGATLGAGDLGRASRFTTSFIFGLIHCLGHRSSHSVADCEAGSQPGACASSAAARVRAASRIASAA